MKIGEILQQGDVLLERVEKIGKGENIKPEKERGYVLAEGEVSGHCHKITEVKSVTMVKTDDGRIYLSVKTVVPLKHNEHHIIIIEPGEYEVRKVVERDHFHRATRKVVD